MLNPFESNGLYKKNEQIRRLKITKSMLQSFSHCVKESEPSNNKKNQPIKFDKYLISKTELQKDNYNGKTHHDKGFNNKEKDKYNDDINYKRLMDYMLFGGKEYQYENPSRFGRFFGNILWSKDIKASPISIFNFVMNLPYLVFNFDKVKNNQVETPSSNSKIMQNLGLHFFPTFRGLHDVNNVRDVMNEYYIKYSKTSDCYDGEMLTMLKSLYSSEYQEIDPILKINSQKYFKDILQHMCDFINYTSNNNLIVHDNSQKQFHLRDIIPGVLQDKTYLIEPDLVILDKENVARIIIAMKGTPRFKDFKVEVGDTITPFHDNEKGDSFKISKFHKILDQLLVNMLVYDCPRGILSDGYTVILVEVETSKLRQQSEKIGINEIPLTMTTFDCKSLAPSYLQWILAYLMRDTLESSRLDPNGLLGFEEMQDTKYPSNEGDKYADDKGNIHQEKNIKPDNI